MEKDSIAVECPKEFEVRQPRWLLIVGIILVAVAISSTTYAAVKMHAGVYDINDGAMFTTLSCVCLFIAIICFYSYANDTFKYTDGEFLCKRTFRRTKIWNVNGVSRVRLIHFRGGINIDFYGENGNRIATVTDGLWVWNDGRLRTVLYCYNIPVEGLDD